MAPSLRVYAGGAGFPGCLWPIILLMPIFGLPQGPSWWHTHLSIRTDSRARVSERFAGLLGAGVCSLLNSSSWFWQQLVFSLVGLVVVTHVSYFCVWPRWAVLVSGFLTLLSHLTGKRN